MGCAIAAAEPSIVAASASVRCCLLMRLFSFISSSSLFLEPFHDIVTGGPDPAVPEPGVSSVVSSDVRIQKSESSRSQPVGKRLALDRGDAFGHAVRIEPEHAVICIGVVNVEQVLALFRHPIESSTPAVWWISSGHAISRRITPAVAVARPNQYWAMERIPGCVRLVKIGVEESFRGGALRGESKKRNRLRICKGIQRLVEDTHGAGNAQSCAASGGMAADRDPVQIDSTAEVTLCVLPPEFGQNFLDVVRPIPVEVLEYFTVCDIRDTEGIAKIAAFARIPRGVSDTDCQIAAPGRQLAPFL